jgi:hypothetical protein
MYIVNLGYLLEFKSRSLVRTVFKPFSKPLLETHDTLKAYGYSISFLDTMSQ